MDNDIFVYLLRNTTFIFNFNQGKINIPFREIFNNLDNIHFHILTQGLI